MAKRERVSIGHAIKTKALDGITNDETIRSYKASIKDFVGFCHDAGYTNKDLGAIRINSKAILSEYVNTLQNKGLAPASIHTRIAPVCKGLGVKMADIEKPKRTSDVIKQSRSTEANQQGKSDLKKPENQRLVNFARAVGIRRSEYGNLMGKDLVRDERGHLCVRVRKGKGGKEQLQMILPADMLTVRKTFQGVAPEEKVFSAKEMNNKIPLHALRRDHANAMYKYIKEKLEKDPSCIGKLRQDLIARWKNGHIRGKDNSRAFARFKDEIYSEKPYALRGANKKRAIKEGRATELNRLALMYTSVFALSHWRLDVTAVNYDIG